MIGAHGRPSPFVLVPVGTAAAIVLYVDAGGPIMLVTWLVAATPVLRSACSSYPA